MLNDDIVQKNLERLTQWALTLSKLNGEAVMVLGVRKGGRRDGLKVLWLDPMTKLELADMLDQVSRSLHQAHREEYS